MCRRVVTAVVALLVMCGLIHARGARADGEVVWYKSMPGIVPATATVFGLYDGADFRLVRGTCDDCPASKQALWYFRDELIAVPNHGVTAADFSRGVEAQEDVRRWYAHANPQALDARPPLLWIGASHQARDVRLTPDNTLLFPDGRRADFVLVPKIDSNRSYYDESSAAFLRKRALRLRGELRGNTFIARTLWPQDWVADEKQLRLEPLLADESLMSIARRHENARHETFEARLLWERTPAATPAARDWSGRAVLGFLLNGAQGDDDEAHGGHFAVLTGRYTVGGRRGEMADWLVNNFYDLGVFSEKGITAATLPLDNYLADLNSGQAWYRPSYLLVAVLKSERAAYAYQAAIARVYHHFYRQDFQYRHAEMNCVGISMDTLRSLGWSIPATGPTSVIRALLAYPYQSLIDRSFTSGKQAYDYLMQEKTRLYPAAAYEAVGNELLRIAGGRAPRAGAAANALENLLREDLDALVFVRLPQLPSSRAFGTYPVASFDEYFTRVPRDKSQWKIIPVERRSLPPALMEPDTLKPRARMAPWMPAAIAAMVLMVTVGAVLRVRKRRAQRLQSTITY